MRQMLEAGVHFGHQTRYWNPKMAPYIFGHRNKIHIINLERTLAMYQEALRFARQLAANRGTLLFVGTKRQARDILREEAQRCAMPYVDHRWLGGMLTNFKTVKQSIKRLKEMEQMAQDGSFERISKKEALGLQRELAKLQRSLGGIKELGSLPDALFVIDVGYQKGAVAEANKLGVPVIGVVDTNHTPEGISYVIPGNDDSSRAIRLYARGIADAVLEGRTQSLEEVVAASRDEFVEVRKARAPSRRSPCERKRGRAPLFFNLDSARSRHDGNQRRHGQGASRDDRPRHDGMQEGPGRGGRRPEEGRGAAAHQERRQGEQGGGPRCGRGRHRRLPLARCEAGRPRRAQLRDRFRGEERRIPRLRPVAGRDRRDAKSQGSDGARFTENRAAAPGAGAEDRREHLDPPPAPPAGERATGALPARHEDRRAGRLRRRR